MRISPFLCSVLLSALVCSATIAEPEATPPTPVSAIVIPAVEQQKTAKKAQDKVRQALVNALKKIEAGGNVDAANKKGQTALMMAAALGNGVAVDYLLLHQANVGLKDKAGKTALQYAKDEDIRYTLEMCALADKKISAKERAALKKEMADKGVAIDKLHQAFYLAREDTRTLVLSLVMEVVATEEEKAEALRAFSQRQDALAQLLLLRSGANPNQKYGELSILEISLRDNAKADCSRNLLLAGAKADGSALWSALYAEAECNEKVMLLLHAGADVNTVSMETSPARGGTLLDYLVKNPFIWGRSQLVPLLIEKGAHFTKEDDYTALAVACCKGDTAAVKTLLGKNLMGKEVLNMLSFSANADIAGLMIKECQPEWKDLNGALIEAVLCDRLDVVKVFLQSGATAMDAWPEVRSVAMANALSEDGTYKPDLKRVHKVEALQVLWDAHVLDEDDLSDNVAWAVQMDEVDKVRFYLSHGVSVEEEVLLMGTEAMSKGNEALAPQSPAMLALLVDAGVDVNREYKGDTPLAQLRKAIGKVEEALQKNSYVSDEVKLQKYRRMEAQLLKAGAKEKE